MEDFYLFLDQKLDMTLRLKGIQPIEIFIRVILKQTISQTQPEVTREYTVDMEQPAQYLMASRILPMTMAAMAPMMWTGQME